MKKLLLTLAFLISFASQSFAQPAFDYTHAPLEITDASGSVVSFPYILKFPNGSLTATNSIVTVNFVSTSGSGFVPYTGATATVDLGTHILTTTNNITGVITDHFGIHIDNPTNADSRLIPAKLTMNATITAVKVLPVGGTDITCKLSQVTATGGAVNDIFNSSTFTSGSESSPTITNATYSAGNKIKYVSTGITGSVTELLFDVTYTRLSN